MKKKSEKSHPLLQSKGHKPRRGVIRECAFCGEDVYVRPCRADLYKLRFCNRDHQIKYMKANAFVFSCFVCGKNKQTQPHQMIKRKRPTCSITCRSKLKRTDALNRRIREGYTKHQLDRLARYSPEAKAWRNAVFSRDDFMCQICGVRGTYLEADHIKPFAYFPELRYQLSNGRTLCRACHNKTKISAKKMREIYGGS